MDTYRFMELVEKENGFEFYQAFRDELDSSAAATSTSR